MSLPRMSWHIGDYLRDTGHLRAAGHGAYFMLCMHYYSKGALPNDDKQLAAIARMSDKEWKEHKGIIQAFFQDGWKHKRIEQEIKDANDKYEARAAAGKRGGEAKAKSKQNPSNATAELQQPITLSVSKEEDDDDARAREPLISQDAFKLADEITVIVGHDPKNPPPQWYGAAMEVSKWLREGWKREVILIAVQKSLGRKRDGPPNSIRFFEQEIARETARQAAPLPQVTIAEPAKVIINGTDRDAVKSNYREALRELGEFIEGSPEDGDLCEASVRLLPGAGCG